MRRLLACFFTILCSTALYADHPSAGFTSGSGGAINTTGGNTLNANQWHFSVRTQWIKNDRFSDAELEHFARQGIEEVHSVDQLQQTALGISYGLTPKLTLSAHVPYISRKRIREGELEDDGEAEVDNLGDAKGLGDILLNAQYKFFDHPKTQASVLFGLKTPSGNTHEKIRGGARRHEAEFQPGSGAWDPTLGFAISHQRGAFSLHGSIDYHFVNDGSQNTNLGDLIDYDLAVVYRFTPSHEHEGRKHTDWYWDGMLEMNGESRDKTTVKGENNNNEGGDLIYLSPGIRLSSNQGFSAYLSLGLPVYEDLNGQQSKPDYRIIGGFGVTF